jgi:hypothetical protein
MKSGDRTHMPEMDCVAAPVSAGTYEINPQALLPYEAAALTLTLLTYPPLGPPDATFEQRFAEICAWVIRRLADGDPDWAHDPRALRPAHALVAPERVATVGRAMGTALERRLAAGRMAVPFIDQAALGDAGAILPPGAKRLSLNEVAAYVAGADSDASNLETRAFRPSLPVLHLCSALAWTRALLGERAADDGRSLVDFLISDMKVLKAFVTVAQAFEAPLLASKKLDIKPERLVRVRWIDA